MRVKGPPRRTEKDLHSVPGYRLNVGGMTNREPELVHVPAECTLATAEQPLRITELQDVFELVRAVERPAPTRLLLTLQPAFGRADRVRNLAARESACCSFFNFTVCEEHDGVLLEITVPPAQLGVLDAMAEQVIRAAGRT